MDVNIPCHRCQQGPHDLHKWQSLISCAAVAETSLRNRSVPSSAQLRRHDTSRGCVSSPFRGSTGNTFEVHTLPYSLQASQCPTKTQLTPAVSLPRVPKHHKAVLCCTLSCLAYADLSPLATASGRYSITLTTFACSTPSRIHPRIHCTSSSNKPASATAHVQRTEAHQYPEGQQQW